MKKAVIIGASSGIGREIAKVLLHDGWRVGIAARRMEELEKIKVLNPDMVEIRRIDVTSNDAATLLRSLIDDLGGISLYVHVSGIGKENASLNTDIEEKTVETNVLGFTNMVGTAFIYMAENGGGQIAVISSIAGTKGLGVAASYSASKAFQSRYTQALEQLANNRRLNIRFTDIRPGFVDTSLLAGGNYPMRMKAGTVARLAVKAIYKRRHVKVIDWRYSVLVWFWRLIPNNVWRKVNLG